MSSKSPNSVANRGQVMELHEYVVQPVKPFAWFKSFATLWMAQLLILLCSEMLSLALRVWMYTHSNSQDYFMIMVLISEGSGILISPLAGIFIDAFRPKLVFVVSYLLIAANSFVFYYLVNYGHVPLILQDGTISILPLAILSAITTVCLTFVRLTVSTVTVCLTPTKAQLGRVAGAINISPALASLLAPMMTAGTISILDYQGTIFAQGFSALISLILILFISLPYETKYETTQRPKFQDLWFSSVFEFFAPFKQLRVLLPIVIFGSVSHGMGQVLLHKLVQFFPRGLQAQGLLLTFAGAGGVGGSLFIAFWGMSEKSVPGLTISMIGRGILIALCGYMWWGPPNLLSTPTIPTCTLATAYAILSPVAVIATEILFHKKFPCNLKGRIYSFYSMLARTAALVGVLAATPMVDGIFEPLFLEPPTWSFAGSSDAELHILSFLNDKVIRWVNTWIGFGSGKGTSIVLVFIGLIQVVYTIFFYRKLAALDRVVPDIELPNEELLKGEREYTAKIERLKKTKEEVATLHSARFKQLTMSDSIVQKRKRILSETTKREAIESL